MFKLILLLAWDAPIWYIVHEYRLEKHPRHQILLDDIVVIWIEDQRQENHMSVKDTDQPFI